MKSLLAAAVICTFLAVNHATSPDLKNQKLSTGNEAPSSSISGDQQGTPCLIHFVDRDIYNNSYLANGALINKKTVLTTRNFLEPYENDTRKRNLYVYPHNWKIKNQILKVNKVFIDHESNSLLAVAHLDGTFEYTTDLENCVLIYDNDIFNPRRKIIVSGWRFTGQANDSEIKRKDVYSLLDHRECTSKQLRQESYCRSSFAIVTPLGEYKDRDSIMNVGDEGAPVTTSKSKLLLLGIASSRKEVYINISLNLPFLIKANVVKISGG